MKNDNFCFCTIFILSLMVFSLEVFSQDVGENSEYYFTRPATSWNEAIPLGNGRIGAMVWGGTEQEVINMNESTLWSGGPRKNKLPQCGQYLGRIRELINQGQTAEAEHLIDSTMLGSYGESYQPLGNLVLDFKHNGQKTDYRRWLDMEKGVASVSYKINTTQYKREVFVSYPDQVMVVHLSASIPDLSFSISLNSPLRYETQIVGNELMMKGYAPSHVFPEYLGPDLESIYEDGKGMRFQTTVHVINKGGLVSSEQDKIMVHHAEEVILIVAMQTSYNGFDKDPVKEGKKYGLLCDRDIKKCMKKTFEELLETHAKDFSSLFKRVNLVMGKEKRNVLPLDERIKEYKPASDPSLASLFFHFGRYLLISSSRKDSPHPVNLQGIWNIDERPAWSAIWTLDCNVQICYWPAELCNLSECHYPLFRMIKDLSVSGKETAENIWGAEGWVAHVNTDAWRFTSPVAGSGRWAIYQMGSGWLCHHLWEHYMFNYDKEFLSDVYPLMEGAAQYYLDMLQTDSVTGWLVNSPSTSFENEFRKDDGTKGWVSKGSTQDMQIIRDLFRNCIQAGKILKKRNRIQEQLTASLDKLAPMQINPQTGRLQEWLYPWEPNTLYTAQTPHGWGLAPGNQINPIKTPELADAFKKYLDYQKPWKMLDCGSWVGAFSANYWARLHEGNMVEKVIDEHFMKSLFPNFTSRFFEKFWQIDANLGITAAIGEVFLQSHVTDADGDFIIELLPALPASWTSGKIQGVKARGGFEISMEWENGKIKNAEIKSIFGNHFTLKTPDMMKKVTNLGKGEILQL